MVEALDQLPVSVSSRRFRLAMSQSGLLVIGGMRAHGRLCG
jgi:hypothetical protein